MSWDEYVRNCKQAVTQRRQQQEQQQQPQQQQQQETDDFNTLPLQLLQTFRLPGPFFDSSAVSSCCVSMAVKWSPLLEFNQFYLLLLQANLDHSTIQFSKTESLIHDAHPLTVLRSLKLKVF